MYHMKYYVILIACSGMYEKDYSCVHCNRLYTEESAEELNDDFLNEIEFVKRYAGLTDDDLLLKERDRQVFGDTTGKRAEISIEEVSV